MVRSKMRLIIVLSVLSILFFALSATAFAADVSVDIVSFTRGEQEDLRSSELLEARVTGYEGNVRELKYKWKSTLGTYLYVYNSHNMYGINNTDGEIEIYNKNISSSANMSGRSYKDTFTGVGYAWAAIYGANLSNTALVGTITVEVYDANNNLLASDSHTGTREVTGYNWMRPVYEYKGIVEMDLSADVSNIAFGIFEGDTKNVKILLGESSIVHITCAECSVKDVKIVEGKDVVEIVFDGEANEYHIKSVTGVDSGTARVSVSIEKGNCKFHNDTSATREIAIYIYNKPTTTSTATAIMLDNLDDNCRYYIGGVEGKRKLHDDGKEYVVFEGLTPNTEYQVEVVGHVAGTDPVYAYVYERTKPAHTGTIEVILNGSYDTATGVATGDRVDISTILPDCETLYLRYEDTDIYFPLERVAEGVYTSELSNGTYTIYSDNNSSAKLSDQKLTMNDASRTRELFFNSVTYDLNGGVGGPANTTEYYLVESTVTASDAVPEMDRHLFIGWKDQSGNMYKAGETVTERIAAPYTLTAQYVDSHAVYVNMTIKHLCVHGDNHNNDRGRHDITFTVDRRFAGEHNYTELVSNTIDWDGESAFTNPMFNAEYVYDEDHDRTIYTGVLPVLANVEKDAEYTFTTVKSGYTVESVNTYYDEKGDLQINAVLIFDPYNYDLAFSVELDEEAKKVADDLKPVAVNVKVTCFANTPYDSDYGKPEGDDTVSWFTVTQMRETYERIALDANGKGAGTYPVWMATTDTNTPYVYRIEVVSYELHDGSLILAEDVGGAHTTYATADNRYFANVVVDGGKDPRPTDDDTLTGVWYENGTQNGTVTAVVSIEVFDVTFVPNGGVLNGSEDNLIVEHQIGIPSLSAYVPAREGGYIFDGWYYADENGNITDTKAVSEEIIFENETLIAKWRDPLTVKGNVAVAGTYDTEDGKMTIYDLDRIKEVVVLLQRLDANGYPETVSHMIVPVTYHGDYGLGEYSFTQIPDNDHEFRIKVVSANYHTHYLNETSDADVSDYDSYSEENMYMAEFAGDTEANVHIYLHFMPDSFDLEYMVDATSVGAGFRPTSAEVLVLCDTGEHIDPQHWTVISQMNVNGAFVGNDTEISGGIGEGSESVWQNKPDGSTAYDYSMRVQSMVFDGEEVVYNSALPYAIYYNGSARYGEVNGQSQVLVATVVPRMYEIVYEIGNLPEDVAVNNMDSYWTIDQTFEDTYYWSYGKDVLAYPTAEGYTFIGWYDEEGDKVSVVDGSRYGDITLTAKWRPNVEFEVLGDAGYYAETKYAEDRSGVIAFNAHVKNIDVVKDYILGFGIYVYDTTGLHEKADGECVDIDRLVADDGYFHVLVSNIEFSDFATRVLATPYVITEDGVVMGETSLYVAVADINKWLGSKELKGEVE
ncbi:MAG: InlB B-repeat-containing protein [Clostridia bacterium]|nr:InlB B-repeat-containing protein [Clostridia bacterium]